jgi:catechol 2,3-dioxygenase-like lactoylglutathione lyase family enzyme
MKIARVTAPVLTVGKESFEDAIGFYQRLLGEPVRARLTNPTGRLELALIGSMLVIGGAPEELASRRDLKATFIVDSLEQWRNEMDRIGAEIVEPPLPGPMSAAGAVGRFMFVRHPDGNLFEYFQPDAPTPGPKAE